MTRSELLPQIFQLSSYDQILIAEAIRNHLKGEAAPMDEGQFKADLERCVSDADQHPQDQSPLKTVMARLKAGL